MPKLSILIPARNEMFLKNTIDDILEHMEGDTEIICVLDGQWPLEPIPDHDRVTLIYHPESVGQRAATNEAARLSTAKYVMKCDAHCAFDQGFDVKMMEDMQDDWTMVPLMHNLHCFDWVCQDCGHRQYQGPTPDACPDCGGEMERDILWKAKPSPRSTAMRFDRNLRFQYWSAYKKHQKGDLVDTMSILGACWMLTRERYHELNICDEQYGSWGQQGTEVACKTWLSGGRLVCTKKTWFAHMFRTQGGDFGFPYPLSGRQVNEARKYSKEVWKVDNPSEMPAWDKAIYPLQWLIDKFSPVPDWHDNNERRQESDNMEVPSGEASVYEVVQRDMPKQEIQAVPEVQSSGLRVSEMGQGFSKGIVYYTDNRLDERIMTAAQRQLEHLGLPIISVSLASLNGFGENIVLDAERGYLTMFKQILAGLEASTADIIFFCEHDVLYHPSHFEFTPERQDLFYYNQNLWKIDWKTGVALFHYSNHTSQLCAYRELLLEHYRKRVALAEEHGFSRKMGFEPGTHKRKERVDDYWHDTWMSEFPNLDIRHDRNLTKSRWSKDEFRNQKYTKGWTIADEVPGWGTTKGQVDRILELC